MQTLDFTQLQELELVVTDTNSLVVSDAKLLAITETLRPIVEALPASIEYANTVMVNTPEEAETAAARRDQIVTMFKLAESSIRDFDEGLMNRLYKAHKRWTAFVGLFAPLDDAAKKIKRAVITYQEEEERKARAEQARLQAIADKAAREERERLLKQAEKLKTPEKQEERREAAREVFAPVVTVARTVAAVKTQKRWKVRSMDLTAMGIPLEIQGYIDVSTGRLERAKAANSMLEVKGVEFHQVTI